MKKLIALVFMFAGVLMATETNLLTEAKRYVSEIEFSDKNITIGFNDRFKFVVIVDGSNLGFDPNRKLSLKYESELRLANREIHIEISPYKSGELIFPEKYKNIWLIKMGDNIQTHHYVANTRKAIVIYVQGLNENNITELKGVISGKNDLSISFEKDLAIIELPRETVEAKGKSYHKKTDEIQSRESKHNTRAQEHDLQAEKSQEQDKKANDISIQPESDGKQSQEQLLNKTLEELALKIRKGQEELKALAIAYRKEPNESDKEKIKMNLEANIDNIIERQELRLRRDGLLLGEMKKNRDAIVQKSLLKILAGRQDIDATIVGETIKVRRDEPMPNTKIPSDSNLNRNTK